MAIFGKDGAQQGARNGATIIAAGTQFVGDITLNDDLHVDGRVEGDVASEAGVVIGADGELKGRIEASTVIVSGHVEGSIKARRLEIIAGGGVKGDVHTVEFVIEPGGRFNGSSENVAEEHQPRSGQSRAPGPADPDEASSGNGGQAAAARTGGRSEDNGTGEARGAASGQTSSA